MIRVLGWSLLVAACGLSGGCHYLKRAEIPMSGEYFHYREDNRTLVVLLHGLGGESANFVNYRTVDQILECRPDANVYGADSHFGYYRERIIVERLRQDVIAPARARGITQIWLAGVSLGGFGSLVYRLDHADDVEGVILVAPYLGEWDSRSTARSNGTRMLASGDIYILP